MIVLFDSSDMVVRTTLINGERVQDYTWEAGRTLARDMLMYLRDRLAEHGMTFDDVTGIGVYQGPGSYTGLRIGLSVLNTLAESRVVPIVGATGEAWQTVCRARLAVGENDGIVMPFYGGDAHVTAPRK